MNRKIEVRNTVYRMSNVLYLLELMDPWNIYWAAHAAAEDAYVAHYTAWDAYYKGLKEIEDEK